jgi:hypothetical protein
VKEEKEAEGGSLAELSYPVTSRPRKYASREIDCSDVANIRRIM